MQTTMKAMDAISGAEAECFITINGRRYNFMQLYKFDADLEVSITEVPIRGRRMQAHKPGKMKGSWKGTAHYNQSVMRELLLAYKTTGVMPYFEIQVGNEDPASAAGRQTVLLKECLSEGGTLAKFDEGEELLEEELSGTFDDFEIPEKFKLLSGM